MELGIIESNLLFDTFEEPVLKAEKISVYYDGFEAAKIAAAWKTVAFEKANLATVENEKNQFYACANISDCVASSLEYPSANKSYYTCKDKLGNDQAMMVCQVNYDHVYVNFLVTNPHNIHSTVNDREPNKVKGAGTCLLQKAEEIAIKEGKEFVCLTPLPTAVSFYEKNGFVKSGWGMIKTVEKAEAAVLPIFVAA